MPQAKIKSPYLLLFLVSFLSFFICTPTLTRAEGTVSNPDNTDRFYGHQSLNELMAEETAIISLPGGTRVEREEQITYTLTDHLGSANVAIADGNTIAGQIDYTPFGVNKATGKLSPSRSYTGMDFESETGTYDYHARQYDGSTGRFTSVDAIRQSISPYSYASDNPIVYLDKTGLGRTPFFVELGTRKESVYRITPKILSENLGNFTGHQVYDANVLFGKEKSQTWHRLKGKIDGGGSRPFNNYLVFLVEDSQPVPDFLVERLKYIRENWKGFADEITIFNLSSINHHQTIRTALKNIVGKEPTVFNAPLKLAVTKSSAPRVSSRQ